MAAANPAEIIRAESICPICLDFFTEPVVIGCGHNFCRGCIKQCLEGQESGGFSCPQCRTICLWNRIQPNRLLVSVVEAAKQMSVAEAVKPRRDSVCQLHNEELKLYCHDDETLVCTVCDRSREHRYHSVVPVEEAAEDFKKSFQHSLGDMKIKLEDLVTCRHNGEATITNVMKEIEAQRTYIKIEMEKLHKRLKYEEEILLYKLVVAEISLSVIDTKIIRQASEKIENLKELIVKIEASCQQPAKEIMKDAKDFLARIHKELHEESNVTAHQFEGVVSAATHEASTYPRYNKILGALHGDDSEDEIQEATAPQINPPKKSTFFKKVRKCLQRKHRKSNKQQPPGDTAFSHAAVKTAIVIYDYEGEDENDLSIIEGDIIKDIDMFDNGWWFGYCNGKYGIFPANYVALL